MPGQVLHGVLLLRPPVSGSCWSGVDVADTDPPSSDSRTARATSPAARTATPSARWTLADCIAPSTPEPAASLERTGQPAGAIGPVLGTTLERRVVPDGRRWSGFVEASDLIVRGRAQAVRLGRTIAGHQRVLITVRSEEVLEGTPETGSKEHQCGVTSMFGRSRRRTTAPNVDRTAVFRNRTSWSRSAR